MPVRAIASGSSPHTRGARDDVIVRLVHIGIIPAYAGSTTYCWNVRLRTADHPRIRGEHSWWSRGSAMSSGSSPHTRGAPVLEMHAIPLRDIIPAYAGSTGLAGAGVGGEGDHPRIRGEHTRATINRADPAGSSPHTRGALDFGRTVVVAGRIIPAYAGSTPKALPRTPTRPDHPRIRGEHPMRNNNPHGRPGSSPHTRGAHVGDQSPQLRLGIIPAYAGSTSPWTASPR